MSWKDKIRQCYREVIGTGDLYSEQEAIIEVVEALIKETEQNTAKEIFDMWDKTDWEEWDDYVASQSSNYKGVE